MNLMRNVVPSLICCFVAFFFVLVFSFEIMTFKNPGEGEQELADQPSVKQSEAPAPREKPKASSADLLATILARPLFQPGRRPPVPEQAQAPALVLPRLAGIVIVPGNSVAIFQPASSPRPIVLKTGEVLEKTWDVASIAAGEVTLTRGDTVLVLTPHGAAKPDLPNPEPTRSWKVGLRRSDPLPSYLQRRG